MIHSHRRSWYNMFVVHIRRYADNPAGRRTDIDELQHGIGPHHVTIDCILIWKHPLGDALAHNHHRLATSSVGIVEITPRDKWNSQRGKKSRRNNPEPRAWIFFARRAHVAIRRKLEAETKIARIAPRNHRTH